MIERLKILTLMQLKNKKKFKIENKHRFMGVIALKALNIILITIIMTFVLYFLNNILYIPVNHYFIIFILMLTQGMNIISSTISLMMDLYLSKDNQILLTFPAKNNEVFISKLIVHYIQEFSKNLYVIIPILIAFGYINKIMFLYYVNIIPMIIIFPVLSILIASLLSIPIVFIRNYLKTHHLTSFIMTIIFIGFLYFQMTSIVSKIPYPIRIVQLYNQFVISITLFMQSSASYGLIYNRIGQLIYGIRPYLNYAILIFTISGLFICVLIISRPLYFKLATKSLEHNFTKQHKKTNKAEKSLYLSFLRKEWLITKRSLNELIANYSLLVTLPFFMYILNYIYMGLNRSTIGNQLVMIFNIMIALFITTASNIDSATAITKEGTEFVLLKTAPSDTTKVAWAKITFNVLFSFVIILISFILFQNALPVFPRSDIWYLFSFIILINTGHIFWSFQMDILKPSLSDYAQTGSLSGNKNISMSISTGFALSLVLSLISIMLFFLVREVAWFVLIFIAILFLCYRLYFFNSFLKAYFMDIEL
jgi:hypothetical protein